MSDLTGLALVISAILTPASVVFLAWLNNRSVKRVEEKVESVDQTATLINHAVNGRDPRQTTLSEDVITIRDKQESDAPSPKPPPKEEAVLPLLRDVHSKLSELLEKE